MDIESKIKELGIEMPQAAKAVGSYVPVAVSGKTAYVSGQIPVVDGTVKYCGKVPSDISMEEAQQAARVCTLNALAQLKNAAGSLDKISRIIKIEVFVNSSAGFTDQAKVANGASDLLIDIYGEAGKHARAAVGVAELPLNSAVEISMIAEIY